MDDRNFFVCLLCCVFIQRAVEGNPTLSFTYDGVACPQEEVTFTCSITGTILRWSVVRTSGQQDTTTFFGDQPARQINSPGVGVFTASVTSPPPNFISTLSTTATTSLEGILIECVDLDNTLTNATTIHIATLPSMPQNLRISNTQNGTESSLVTFQWEPPSDNGGDEVDSYSLTASGGISRSGITDTITSIELSYNVEYTVRVSAVNCAGTGPEAVEGPFTLNRVDCSSPVAANGVIIEPYTRTTEGAVIHYQCGNTFVPNTMVEAMCGRDGTWSPNPSQHSCQLVDCGNPQLTENTTVINSTGTLKGQEVTFQCNIGPNLQPITTVCMAVSGSSEGVWSPDPELVVCGSRVTCVSPSAPVNGFIGEVTQNIAQFGCNEEYSPQGTMTAVCVATDTWSPDPTQLECTLPTTIHTVVTVMTTNSGSVTDKHVTTTVAAIIGVMCSAVSCIVGVIFTILIYLAITRCKKTHKQVTITSSEERSEAPNTAPPVYEDIPGVMSLKTGIELQENVAYGPIKK